MSNQKERATILDSLITDDILSILLIDRTTEQNIIWATEDYLDYGIGYAYNDPIRPEWLRDPIGKKIIRPRIEKSKEMQTQRSKEKAEVFTPSWVCNAQNNLVDRAWFGARGGCFNVEKEKGWETDYKRIFFPNKPGKTWMDYVKANRLEITCGEAPYLTSRYDAVTGKWIPVKNRIGLLDRKLRVVGEQNETSGDWIRWAKEALKSVYGFEWQGDSLFLARKNLLCAVIESYFEKFRKPLNRNSVRIMAEIISWNLWQMDGLKFVVPGTCYDSYGDPDLLGKIERIPCPGCKSGDRRKHNGIYSLIMDWEEKAPIWFVSMVEGGKI